MNNYIDIIMYSIGFYTAFVVGVFKIGLNGRKAQRLVRLVGEGVARLFYIVLGIGIMIATAFGVFR